jgi:hypothetical protein
MQRVATVRDHAAAGYQRFDPALKTVVAGPCVEFLRARVGYVQAQPVVNFERHSS